MNETDFEALNEHLAEVRPVFDDFCAQNGFSYVQRTAIGRYPRIRIVRERLTRLYFDLWMDLDNAGQRFQKFSQDLPYSLYAGASIIEDSGAQGRIRFQKDITCFSGKPFEQVKAIVRNEMGKYLPELEQWNVQHLRDMGRKVRLRN